MFAALDENRDQYIVKYDLHAEELYSYSDLRRWRGLQPICNILDWVKKGEYERK